MDHTKINIAMATVAAIIVWIAGAYALEAWRNYQFKRKTRLAPPAQAAKPAAVEEPTAIPPAAAA